MWYRTRETTFAGANIETDGQKHSERDRPVRSGSERWIGNFIVGGEVGGINLQ